MNNFDYLLAELAIGIFSNDLELTESITKELNSTSVVNTSDTSWINISDIYDLRQDNESFHYFLDNFTNTDLTTLKGMWDVKSTFIYEKFKNGLCDKDEVYQFLEKTYNDIKSPIREYRYTILVRLALALKDLEFIIKLKQQMNEE